MHHGRCLCGQIEYEIDGDIGPIDYCHCSYCRRASGSAFASNATIMADTFRVRSGASLLKEYEASPGKLRAFCSNCGSPIFARRVDAPPFLRIRMGTLTSDPHTTVTGHYDVESKAAWHVIADDGLPRFDANGYPAKRSD